MSVGIRRSLAAVGVTVLAAFGAAVPAMAHEETNQMRPDKTQAQEKIEAKKEEIKRKQEELKQKQEEKRKEVKERIQGRLDETRKKVCTQRLEAIKRLMAQQAQQGEKHFAVFEKIAERVNEFYNSKKPSVPNYAALLDAVDVKKAAAMNAILTVKNGVSFDCNGENPVGNADQFKNKVRAMHAALKDYRAAINELLKAVKSAAGEAKKQEGTQ